MQLVLFFASVSDDACVSPTEMFFIKSIAKHGDIFADGVVDASVPGTNTRVSCDNIVLFPPDLVKGIFSLMYKYVLPHVRDLVFCLGLIEKRFNLTGSSSGMFQLEEKLVHMGTYLGLADNAQVDKMPATMTAVTEYFMKFRHQVERGEI